MYFEVSSPYSFVPKSKTVAEDWVKWSWNSLGWYPVEADNGGILDQVSTPQIWGQFAHGLPLLYAGRVEPSPPSNVGELKQWEIEVQQQ